MTDMTPDTSVDNAAPTSLLGLTAQIVAAYTGKNAMPGSDLPALIDRVFQSLAGVATGKAAAPEAPPTPAVPVKKSVFSDYIVCLEDGKKMKMLKRHLMTSYGLTPQAYRERWGLPSDYPMVAPSYAEKRSTLAKSIGLGRKPPGAAAAEVAPEAAPEEEQVTPIPKTRGRKLAKAAEATEE
ncbi:MAG: MucR family transcriptional regulator [Janthinobacterium lividum]